MGIPGPWRRWRWMRYNYTLRRTGPLWGGALQQLPLVLPRRDASYLQKNRSYTSINAIKAVLDVAGPGCWPWSQVPALILDWSQGLVVEN